MCFELPPPWPLRILFLVFSCLLFRKKKNILGMICRQPFLVGVDGGSCGGIWGHPCPGRNILFSTWICTSNRWTGRWVHWEDSRPEGGVEQEQPALFKEQAGEGIQGERYRSQTIVLTPAPTFLPANPLSPSPTLGGTRCNKGVAAAHRGLHFLVQFLPAPPLNDHFHPGPFLPGARFLTSLRPALHSVPPFIFRPLAGLAAWPLPCPLTSCTPAPLSSGPVFREKTESMGQKLLSAPPLLPTSSWSSCPIVLPSGPKALRLACNCLLISQSHQSPPLQFPVTSTDRARVPSGSLESQPNSSW